LSHHRICNAFGAFPEMTAHPLGDADAKFRFFADATGGCNQGFRQTPLKESDVSGVAGRSTAYWR